MFVFRNLARKQWATLILATSLALFAQWIPLKEPAASADMLAGNSSAQETAKQQPEQS